MNHHNVYKKFPATSNQGISSGVASVWWPLPGAASGDGEAPAAGYTIHAGTIRATAGYSWIVRLLPFLGEVPVYNQLSQASRKFTADAFTPYDVGAKANGAGEDSFSVTITRQGEVTSKHFAALQLDESACPSYGQSATVTPSAYEGTPGGNPPADYGYPKGSDLLGNPPQMVAVTNYVALAATHFPLMQNSPISKVAATTTPDPAEAANGVIVPGGGLNAKAITDGAANTLMVCETIEPAMSSWYDGTTAWTTAINPNSLAKFPPSKADPTPDGTPNPNHFWFVPAGGSTALNVGPGKDKKVAYSPALAGYCATPQVISWGPSSNHSGGIVNHIGADGAIHPITDDIDPTLYMHLVTAPVASRSRSRHCRLSKQGRSTRPQRPPAIPHRATRQRWHSSAIRYG